VFFFAVLALPSQLVVFYISALLRCWVTDGGGGITWAFLFFTFIVIKYILLACERIPWSIGGAFLPAGAPTFGVAAVRCLSLGVCVFICSSLDAQCIPACVVVFLDTAQLRV